MNESLRRTVVVIPALEPGVELVGLAAELLALGMGLVVVVDDGSSAASAAVWAGLALVPGVQVVHMPRLAGKGAALKAGFAHLLEGDEVWDAVVTADADGQHRPGDVARVAAVRGFDLVLGARGMGPGVPWRSRLGNGLTRRLFALVARRGLRDTQTGLRRFVWELLPALVGIAGERYEYESTVLLWACARKLSIGEVQIATVYEAGNAGSHFRPVRDSVRVWGAVGGAVGEAVWRRWWRGRVD